MSIELLVNGQSHTLDVTPDVPLLYVLRNQLGLTSAKLGCGLEQCGACAVLVDGESRLSCVQPVAQFAGKAITTAEGLCREAGSERLRAALSEQAAAQCGYCLPGIFVALTALLNREPAPSESAIRAALQPHLCRCGSQARILRAARRAPESRAPESHGETVPPA